jgi:hypothetical protein
MFFHVSQAGKLNTISRNFIGRSVSRMVIGWSETGCSQSQHPSPCRPGTGGGGVPLYIYSL